MADVDVIEQLRDHSVFEVDLGRFATREDLVAHVLDYIYSSEKNAEESTATGPSDLDTYFDGIIAAFEWNLDPANSFLRRVAFEAAAFDFHLVQPHYRRWLDEATTDLQAIGLTETDAAIESRILNNLFLGFTYDHTINRDPEATRTAFLSSLQRFRERLVHLIELSV